MSEKPLTQEQIAVLLALYEATKGSIHAHVPKRAVQAHFRKDLRGFAGEALDELIRHPSRYAIKHPTKGEMTYSITLEGIKKLKEMKLI